MAAVPTEAFNAGQGKAERLLFDRAHGIVDFRQIGLGHIPQKRQCQMNVFFGHSAPHGAPVAHSRDHLGV